MIGKQFPQCDNFIFSEYDLRIPITSIDLPYPFSAFSARRDNRAIFPNSNYLSNPIFSGGYHCADGTSFRAKATSFHRVNTYSKIDVTFVGN